MNINFIITHINTTPDYDPLNPPRTVSESRFSYDPIHPDALAIIEKLKNAVTEGEVLETVWDAFRDLLWIVMNGIRTISRLYATFRNWMSNDGLNEKLRCAELLH